MYSWMITHQLNNLFEALKKPLWDWKQKCKRLLSHHYTLKNREPQTDDDLLGNTNDFLNICSFINDILSSNPPPQPPPPATSTCVVDICITWRKRSSAHILESPNFASEIKTFLILLILATFPPVGRVGRGYINIMKRRATCSAIGCTEL